MAANILSPIGHNRDETFIPNAFLAPVVREALAQMQASLSDEFSFGSGQNGAVEIISERAAPRLGVKPEAIKRRLWGITREEFNNTSARHADAILLAANVKYEEHDLPELPAGLPAAIEMVDAYFEYHDDEPDPASRRDLSRLLFRFAVGFSNGDRAEEMIQKLEELAAAEAEEVEEAVAA